MTVVAPLFSLEDFDGEEVAVVAVGQKNDKIEAVKTRKRRK